ncbi:MAG: Na/Pi cotransporter family protein [Clostridia bacterium]|nr:Na/Pi cotransporter family protein [Clostridia bacterium]
MSVMNVLSLLGGLGMFLFGMKIMGDGLEKAAGNRLKKLLGIVTHNRVLAMLAGLVITAVIQSSSATTVMVVGFVNAALINLTQAVGVIMGANIGTTVTSLLLSVKIDFAAVFACIGLILTMLPKKLNTARQFGDICLGLGILFVGMNTMSTAMKPLQDWDVFTNAITGVTNPVVGVLVGALITAVLQSSSASVGILQALAGEGLIPLKGSMFILFGQNIGTCITALIACSGTNTNAKRAAVVHLLFNVIGAVLFTVLTVLLPLDQWIISLAPDNLRLQIAFIHIIFNVTTTALMLPLAKLLEKIACLVVREKNPGAMAEPMRLKYFDERLLNTPPIAAAQLFREVQRMGEIALNNFTGAMSCFESWDEERVEEINRNEEVLDYLNKEITSCLVEVRGLDLNEKDAHMVGSLFHVVNDWERVGDHAINVLDAARSRQEQEIKFSAKAVAELENLSAMVMEQLTTATELFNAQSDDAETIQAVEAKEQEIDDLTEALRIHHVERVKNKKCSAKNGMLYLDILTNLERIGDHAENIATSTESLTSITNKW